VGDTEEGDTVWAEARERQAGSQGRLPFPPAGLADALGGLDEAVVRISAGVAYVRSPVADPRDPAEIALAERVRAQLDPAGVLA
jgi:hypothetical protein